MLLDCVARVPRVLIAVTTGFMALVTALPAQALRCPVIEFLDPDKPLAVRKKLAAAEAIKEVRRYDLIFWGRATQWQCLGPARDRRGGISAMVMDFQVDRWVKGGSGPAAQMLIWPTPEQIVAGWCAEGRGSGASSSKGMLHVMQKLAPHTAKSYPPEILADIDGTEAQWCPIPLELAFNDEDRRQRYDTRDEPFWQIFKAAAEREIAKLERRRQR